MDAMQAIRETFFQECEEQLGELETGLIAMEAGDTDTETVNAVFRAVHSIKGGAGAFKLDRLVRFAHGFETTLDKIRNGVLAPTQPIMKVMLRAADVLADLVKDAREGVVNEDARAKELLAELGAFSSIEAAQAAEAKADDEEDNADPFEALGFEPLILSIDSDDPSTGPTPAGYIYRIAFKPKPELYYKGNETSRLIRELGRLGPIRVKCEAESIPTLNDLDPEAVYLAWSIELSTEQDEATVRGVFEFVDGDCDLDIDVEIIAPEPGPEAVDAPSENSALTSESQGSPTEAGSEAAEAGKSAGEAVDARASRELSKAAAKPDPATANANSQQGTIRVDLDRVDRLINLVGELVINQAMLTQRVLEAGVGKAASVSSGLDDLEHLTREIQESVMAIRAQPVRPLFQRMARIVREVADATGKSVQAEDRRRRRRSRQDRHRTARRSAHPHDPQRGRPRPGAAGKTPGGRASPSKAKCV